MKNVFKVVQGPEISEKEAKKSIISTKNLLSL